MDFDADLTSTDSGVWEEFEGSEFLIAHMSNMKFQRALARLQQPHRRKIENGTLDPEVNKKVLCRAMAEGLVLDWRKVTTKKDKTEVPYSSDNCFRSLMGNAEFRDFVSGFAMELTNFKNAEVEELGNS
jgi:hypothetical protein